MSHDKAILSGKEHRKPYRRGKSTDSSCRNHGACEYCQGSRTYFDKKSRSKATQQLMDYKNE